MIALGGHRADRPDDPYWTVPSSPLDVQVMPALSRDQREDLQALNFLQAVAATGQSPSIGILPVDDDPPDRELIVGANRWGLELTEFTIEEVRGELARARAFGRDVQAALRAERAQFPHLHGRRVVLSLMRDIDAAGVDLDALMNLLAVDKGWVGEGLDFSQGLPQQWNDRGMYGEHGPYVVQVYADGVADDIIAVASAQADVFRSDIMNAITARIQGKDHPPNSMLLVTCALPDARGYICGLDRFLFQLLAEASQEGVRPPAPGHLDGVALHLWGTFDWLKLYARPGVALPWRR